ncbi:MAG TPA: PAS domain-containing sensor histidine kinase, partial [Candidatus Acidoferrales bacterium]|nr:PAS domain-containing sensor histidine kinase [Candidatus Acidoferrales bacterium]
LEGRKFTEFLHPEDLERTELEVSFVMEGRAVYHFENRYARKDGATTYLAWSASWSPTDRLLFCVARDISEQKRAEDQRIQMELQLRHAQKLEAIGQLAAGIAHEINTPTQFTEHNLRFLQETFPKLIQSVKDAEKSSPAPDGNEFEFLVNEIPAAIEEALQGTERISKIVRAMKEFSHPGNPENSKPEPADINHAIETTITVARSEWKHVAEMVTEFDPALPRVPVFASEFNQVILNLVVNAAHAITEATNGDKQRKGIITVSTRHDGNWAEVRVKDNGTGIPEDVRDRIFVPFFTTKKVGLGTGQGLTLAHSVIVKKHLGDLRFETETGKGTSFIIRLPLGESAEKAKK